MLKRKRYDDSDDEDPSLGRQILPVANLPEDFNQEPTDGMQYLFTVRRDARHLPHITRSDNPYEHPETAATLALSDPLQANHPALPSEQWRKAFEEHLRNLRSNIAQPTIHVQLPPQYPNHKLMPDKRERDSWWNFIEGKAELHWNSPKIPKQTARTTRNRKIGRMRGFDSESDSDAAEDSQPLQETWHINDEGEVELALREDPAESLPTPSGTPAPQENSNKHDLPEMTSIDEHQEPHILNQREPTPSLLRHIDHRMSLHLLMYFTHWINVHVQKSNSSSSPLTETHARWIFALLLRVEEYIAADDMSLLRNLARACLALLKELIQNRSSTSEGKEISSSTPQDAQDFLSERSCWMVISAIVGVWGQRDLWMDADTMLRRLHQ